MNGTCTCTCLGGTLWSCEGDCGEEEACDTPGAFGAVGDTRVVPCVPRGGGGGVR